MKHSFYVLIGLLLGWIQIGFSQYGGDLGIKTGNTVFFKMNEHRVYSKGEGRQHAIYQIKTPVYMVGTLIDQTRNPAKVNVKYFLYACSNTSAEWIKTSKLTLEKHANNGELVGTETLDVSSLNPYKENLYYIHPLTDEALQILTKGNVVNSTSSCPQIIVKDKVAKPRK